MKTTSTVTACLALVMSACTGARSLAPLGPLEREERVRTHLMTLGADSTALTAVLRDMPKGGDLHSHTSGAIATEKLIQWGAEDGACVDPTTWVASQPCAPGAIPLSRAAEDRHFHDSVVRAWSMEGYAGPRLGANPHFFGTFARFGAVQPESRTDDSYADILARAGRHHQLYVELMQGFGASTGGRLAAPLFSATDAWDTDTLLARRQQLLALPDFQAALSRQVTSIAATLRGTRELLGCDGAQPDPGCGVELRFLVAANRTAERAQVFGQWVFAYELAQRVPEVVGVNLVSPEAHERSLAHYRDAMFALGTLDDINDQTAGRKPVHISLHAGELIPAMLEPRDQHHLTFHIREAVEKGHAERIGHGVDVLGETAGDGAMDLLADLRAAGVLVEICLTSNRVLLGARADTHPLRTYLQHGVPVALATDDQGILRGDITQEYLAAVTDQHLDYRTLKQLTRASLEHAFVEGDSLWSRRDDFSAPVDVCARDVLGAAQASASCQSFLTTHRKAALQWKLEGQLAAFEARLVP